MAWRSSGETNEEMVDNLKRYGVIWAPSVEDGFRAVDRKFFVPPNRRSDAYIDQPVREGNLHISAPHIYGSVLEALDLLPNSTSTFLNIGSGTGYLSCLVAHILGPHSSNYAVELSVEAVRHSKQAISAWTKTREAQRTAPHIEILHGSGLDIDSSKGEAAVGFDRIYIGAAVERSDLPHFAGLLRQGGILVGPVGDELVKVTRLSKAPRSQSDDEQEPMIPRSFRGRTPLLSRNFSTSVLSGVRFSPLLQSFPSEPLIIHSRIWEPELHHFYPDRFRDCCKQLLLCSNAPRMQGADLRFNAASLLPKALWMEVLSYTHRDWFEKTQSEEDLLRRRVQQLEFTLLQEQELRQDLEKRLRVAQGERDIYLQLARTWQVRIERLLGETLANEIFDGALVLMSRQVDDNDDGDETVASEDHDEAIEMDGLEEESFEEGIPMDDVDAVMQSNILNISSRQVRTVSISEPI